MSPVERTDSEFDKINEMVLDCYNAVSINLGMEASLFRQVPSARVLTHTDMLPLHVCYMPALYIASKYYNMSCRISSQAYICSHEIHDARCANCKGKMADGSEISGAFWLLKSGASRHFTSDLGDFASYQALKHKHYQNGKWCSRNCWHWHGITPVPRPQYWG